MKTYLRFFFKVIIPLLILMAYVGCETNFPEPSIDEIYPVVVTDENGVILEDDPSQWIPRQPPSVPVINHFGPAYPNPTHADSMIFPIALVQEGFVLITLSEVGSNIPIDTLVSETLSAASYDVKNRVAMPNGIYKAEMTIVNQGFYSFGYIKYE
jgi:hypothetical protein